MAINERYSSVVDTLEVEAVEGVYVKKRMAAVTAIDLYAAKRIQDGLEALIAEVPLESLTRIASWPCSKGFEVTPARLGESRTRICLQLHNDRYRDVFRAMCVDICDVLELETEAVEAIRAFHGRIVKWQEFLSKHGPDGLGELAQCGLFGELLVLRDIVLPCVKGMDAVLSWRGCKKAQQDFQFQSRAIEVKTTRSTIPDKVSINSVQQLDCEGIEEMILGVVHVSANETSGETLPEMVDSLRELLPGDARIILDEGLEAVGYLNSQTTLYARTRYQLIAVYFFKVTDGFPRLTRDRIPEGIKSVTYTISLDACRPFQIQESELLQILRS